MLRENVEEKLFYNALNLASEGNFALIAALQKRFRSFKKAWFSDINSATFPAARFEPMTIQKTLANRKKINPEKEWQRLINLNIKLIFAADENYPKLLKEISDPPQWERVV